MAKSKVFIIWNGDTEIAKLVKNSLDNQNYECVIGGNAGAEGGFTIIDTVISGMNSCNQAIAIIRKNGEKQINGNVLLELGYALSRYGNQKTHVFLIDYEPSDVPSDLSGVWLDDIIKTNEIHPILSETETGLLDSVKKALDGKDGMEITSLYKSLEKKFWEKCLVKEIAKRIVQKFGEKQKNTIPDEKIRIIADYYRYRDLLINHPTNPICSDYELAQYIIFLTQGAYIHDDLDDFKHYLHKIQSYALNSRELKWSVEYAILATEIYCLVETWESVMSTSQDENVRTHKENDAGSYESAKRDFNYYKSGLLKQLMKFYVRKDKKEDKIDCSKENSQYDDYLFWIEASIYQILQYFCCSFLILIGTGADTDDTVINDVVNDMKEYCEKCLEICDKLYCKLDVNKDEGLKKYNAENYYFVQIYRSYIYKNKYEVSQCHSPDRDEEVDETEPAYFEELYLAYMIRNELLTYCRNYPVTDMLQKFNQMEYYLILADVIKFCSSHPSEGNNIKAVPNIRKDEYIVFLNLIMQRMRRRVRQLNALKTIDEDLQLQNIDKFEKYFVNIINPAETTTEETSS